MFSEKVYKHLYKPQKRIKKAREAFPLGPCYHLYLQLNQSFVDHFLSS